MDNKRHKHSGEGSCACVNDSPGGSYEHNHHEHSHEKGHDHELHMHEDSGADCCGVSLKQKKRGGECHCCSDEPHGDGHDHEHGHQGFKAWIPAIISFVLLVAGLIVEHALRSAFFNDTVRLIWYVVAYLPVGIPVIREAIEALRDKNPFSEFMLMAVATIGAFFIGEYPEAVAVMLFYSVGELFQGMAVNKARGNIKALVDVQAVSANVLREGQIWAIKPEEVVIGETIEVRVGEKVPLDGVIIKGEGAFNASALTGESRPMKIKEGEKVLAGMISVNSVVLVRVEKSYSDSSLARILDMVQNASSRKAKTELIIRRFARIYTPIVFLLALLVMFLPALFVDGYILKEWVYRGLVLLVISCPCALVISIPLSYFGGIGAASRQGILFKGANYLELMEKIDVMVMDKTGTLTQGVFEVRTVMSPVVNEYDFLTMTAAVESYSNHPIAKAIVDYVKVTSDERNRATDVEEIAGQGLRAKYDGKTVLVGNTKLMRTNGISYNIEIDQIVESVVVMAADGQYLGYIVIADSPKEDAAQAVKQLKELGIRTVMLSGDRDAFVQNTAHQLDIDTAYGELLPEDKVKHVELLKDQGHTLGFVGDGINDAPVLALSDVGIAMGGMGSDAAIEVADVVIQTDQPTKIVTAIKISRATRRIATQNIVFSLSVKIIVMALGVFSIASMWAAVFADVGVALLAVLNATRILVKKF